HPGGAPWLTLREARCMRSVLRSKERKQDKRRSTSLQACAADRSNVYALCATHKKRRGAFVSTTRRSPPGGPGVSRLHEVRIRYSWSFLSRRFFLRSSV